MLRIWITVGEHHALEEWTWKADGKSHVLPHHRSVIYAEADGTELLFISLHFKGLPMSPSFGVTNKTLWPQPWAQFIVANLPEKVKESLIPHFGRKEST